MQPETPATGILKLHDWGESMIYYINCGCTDSNHAHTLEVEADDRGVNVHITVTAKTRVWQRSRWKDICSLLFKGYCEKETSIILTEQQAINYANTLTTAAEQVKLFKSIQTNKRQQAVLKQ
jgi:hypothetical protein